ncbi:hypothetical protein TVAG_250050 [Trichomonas vaginalis G3]|uniref:Nuclear pore protein n=1 Tax=Trichomonas vaginalis (strain ATCC PRA-98 / G3) TaxID=412133 RepID=A2DCK8_TRIV3|nr:nuclear pore complex assembly [Trichomonas vaginalis G3]EAY21945.1 hypothetical protein TVAG_250050 [Trichomonas vaginalis G3]KAI5487578.1 nuclear pore complex assembly [Trichomonas vaginalis G3]|eukprot:XP_001582931.1 hypothetical protein [Trichomonas vaginalis G3]
MDIPVETQIDDILARSLRLEKKSPYLANYGLSSVLHQSRSIINTRSFSKDDEDRGKYLLGTVNKNIANVPTILKGIDLTSIVSDNVTLYAEKNNEIFQDSIVKSITSIHNSTNSLNDSFILKAMENLYGKKGSYSDVVVPYYEDIPSITPSITEYLNEHPIPSVKMTLRPRDRFYAENLTNQNESFSEHMAKAIRKTTLFKENYQLPLADTFSLIHCLEKYGNHFNGTKRFLEKQIKRIITEEVNTNLNIANRGPTYGIMHTLQGYINLLPHPQHESPWAILFFAMRCGKNESALQYASENNFSHDVISALEFRVTGTEITPQIRTNLQGLYQNEVSGEGHDTFKCLCLSILSGIGGYNDPSVISSFEDWLWFALQLGDGNHQRVVTKVTKTISEISDPRNTFLPGQALLLVHQFDKAANWFLSTPAVANDGLQISLAMHTAGLISPNVFSEQLLRYTAGVFEADGYLSLKYLNMIKDRKEVSKLVSLLAVTARNGESLFEPTIIDQSRLQTLPPPESEASAALFDGISNPQDIINSYRENNDDEEQYVAMHSPASLLLNPEEQKLAITSAGIEAAKRSMYPTAMKLLHMAGDYNRLVDLCCQQLRRCAEGLVDDQPIIDAMEIINEVNENTISVDEKRMRTLLIMLSFAKCAYLTRHGDYELACSSFEESKIFASDQGVINTADNGGVEMAKSTIANMPPSVKEVIPVVLVQAVEAYSKIHASLPRGGGAKKNIEEKVRILAKLAGEVKQSLHEDMARKLLMLKDFDTV